MQQLKSIAEEWAKFTLRGALLISAVSAVFFWNSSHSVEDISLAIAIPLIISNCCVPLLGGLVLRYAPRSEGTPWPQNGKPFSSLAPKVRIVMIVGCAWAVITLLSFIAGLSILMASGIYQGLEITWAIAPARHLARELLLLSFGPVSMIVGFIAGVYCSLRIRQSSAWQLLFSKTEKSLREWPRAA